ncbi:hypothetical protein STEG23_034215 [Scotinomys teguina]
MSSKTVKATQKTLVLEKERKKERKKKKKKRERDREERKKERKKERKREKERKEKEEKKKERGGEKHQDQLIEPIYLTEYTVLQIVQEAPTPSSGIGRPSDEKGGEKEEE